MLEHIDRVLHPDRVPTKNGALTFAEWFNGRFWAEHVLGRKNKPGEMREKKVICDLYLEAGMRVGEIKALRWREDVDMIAKTITINQQTCRSKTGTPKGRTRRTVPMTATLYEALKRMSVIREGFVVRNLDGTQKTDTQAVRALERICRKAKLPVRLWHTLRHTFGTHAALFGVNPWRLQTWLGHKRIDETMLYVHVAEAHAREWPEAVHEAARTAVDPDRRIIAMLGARGKGVAKTAPQTDQNAAIIAA